MSNAPHTQNSPINDSISKRFSHTLIAVVSILLLAFSAAGIYFNIAMMDKNLENRLDYVVELAQISLPTPLWNLDHKVVEDFVEALFLDEAIVYIDLVWKGQTIAKKVDPGVGLDNIDFDKPGAVGKGSKLIRIAADIRFEEIEVGELRILASRDMLKQRVLFQISAIGALTVLIVTAIWFTSIVITKKYIFRPLLKLQRSASAIARGDLDTYIDKSDGGEIGVLSRHLDVMRDSLKELFSKLEASKEKEKEYSRTLAHKVEARTRELSRSVEELQALGEISQAVSSTLDLTAVLTRIVRHAVQLSKADAGTIYEYEGADRLFIPRINYGVNTEFIEALHASGLRVGDGSVMGHAAANQRPDQVPDLDEVPDYPLPFVRKAGFRSLLAVPLLCENHLIGGLIVRRKTAGEFPDRVVDLLQTFAAHSALAIHNAQLFQEIEAKNREIQIANRHKSEFLANMSHELRTPLNAILGFTELILDRIYGDIPEKVQDVLKRLMHNGHHLLGLINDVLDLSKIEAGQLSLSLDDYSIEEMIRTALVSMDALAEEKAIALTHKIQADLQIARGDEQRITQVLLNLLGNAIKFTDRGRVHVAVTGSDSQFQVSVSDTGPGISQADQELIFEAFQQADGSNTREKGGTGLGLSIVKRIVEMHGGDIWVESVLGEGSTFHFRLPIRVERQKVQA